VVSIKLQKIRTLDACLSAAASESGLIWGPHSIEILISLGRTQMLELYRETLLVGYYYAAHRAINTLFKVML